MLSRDVYVPEGGWATSPAYPYEKNGSTFHDITSCELRRRKSSIAYSGVLRRMTDFSYLVQRLRIVRCTIQFFRFHLLKREREKEIDLCRKYGIIVRMKETRRLVPRKFLFKAAENREIEK